jgi:DNA-binding transcriptional MerR regulator
VLRYWEQEFSQLKPVKRRGNRRYYQHHEVLLIRLIRELLYGQGFTINGARSRLEQDMSEPISNTTSASSVAELLTPVNLAMLQGEIKNVVSLLRS